MTDHIPVRYLPTEEAQPAIGQFRQDETVPVVHGGTGATTPADARASLGIVDAPGTVTQFPYVMQIPNSVPVSGDVSFNNADPTLVTALSIHKEDENGTDQTAFLTAIKDGDWVNFVLQSDATVYQQYDATGPAVQNGDHYTVPVAYYGHLNGPLVSSNQVYAYWRIGDTVYWGDLDKSGTDSAKIQDQLDGKAAAAHAANHATGQSDALAPGDIGALTSSDGSVIDVLSMTQAAYDALTPDATTLYLITT